MRTNIERKSLTPKEVSEIYGLPVGTLANWRYQRRGPKYHIVGKRKILYFVKELEEFLTQCPVLTKDSLPEK